MRHLSPEELVNSAEGDRSASSAAHLDACGTCRQEVRALAATMASVAAADVPEPSPLFWDHLSRRVHDAVASEGAPRRVTLLARLGMGGALGPSSWSPLRAGLVAGALAAVVVASVLRIDRNVAGGAQPPAAPASAMASAVDVPEVPADDVSLDLVAGLAADLDWDAVKAAGLQTAVGAADGAVDQLTANERVELNRLLKEALAKPGA